MRVLLAAIRCEKGTIEANLAKHLRLLAQAANDACDLVLFPEMSLTGSVDPGAHPEHLAALDHLAVARLVQATAETGVAACFGLAEGPCGEAQIAQVLAAEGRLAGIQRKRHLGEGEEAFVAASDTTVFELARTKFAIAICKEAGFEAPFDAAVDAGARMVLFPAAPGLYGRRTDEVSWREGFSWWETSSLGDARRHAARLGIWIALASQAGSTLDEDFPGLAALVTPDGLVAARLPDWNEGVLTVEIPL